MKLDLKGEFIPICLAQLDPGEEIYCEGGLLVFSDPSIQFQIRWMTQGGIRGVVRRSLVGGVPFHQHVYRGPGYAAFSRFRPGELRTLDLRPGEIIDVAEHSLLLATNSVRYDTAYVPGTGRIGRMIGFWLDRLTGPGSLVYQGHGNILMFTLAPGEVIDIDHGALLWKDASVRVQAFNQPLGGGVLGHAMSFEALRVQGPGRLALQTLDPTHSYASPEGKS